MIKKLLGEVRGLFNTITLIEMIISLIYIILGIVFYADAKLSDSLVSTITGITLILAGLSTIFSYFKKEIIFRNNLIYGLILTILGIIALIFKNVLILILAIYFMIAGIKKINYGMILRRFDESSWLINTTMGALLIIVGIVSIFTRNGELVRAVGICLFFYGVINLVETIILRRRSKYFL